jgi:hypothetical protein
MVDPKVKDKLVKALREAQLTEEEKIMQWLPVVANTMRKGAMGERKHLYKKSGRPKNEERDKQLAREFLRRRKVTSPRLKDSTLKATIGKEQGLKRSASIEAINKGLQALKKKRSE